LFARAYAAAGVHDTAFDPLKTAPAEVLAQVYHNRDGFSDTKSDTWRSTNLFDRNLQEINSKNVRLDPTLKAWSAYKTRIFVAGDSTASNYGLDVAPRTGWGQVFERQLKDAESVKVVNAAQSGRASRSFVEEGWFKLIEDNIQPGDYLLVQFGHNDEKCAAKDGNDVLHRCTYPGKISDITAKGIAAEMAFQVSLERYIAMAKSKGATPVLITPMTRIVQDKDVKDYEEGKFPITETTHKGPSTSAIPGGDYSQTVRDTAAANNVALVDLDAKSIAFANSIGLGSGGAEAKGGWRDYWLGVSDFSKYPFYKSDKTTGHYKKADRTHFQEKGAEKMGSLIAEGLKEDQAKLGDLIKLLK
jgi:pectinesterase